MPQVYAIVHNGLGDFIIAVKNRKGYFFHTSIEPLRGCVYYDGVDITNGGGRYALPGGKLEAEIINPATIVAGAIQEMLEETTVVLDPASAQPAYFAGEGNRYYGVYFGVAGEAFNTVANTIREKLQRGQAAVDAILRHTWHGNYDRLIREFACPLDNELERSVVWNLVRNWPDIAELELRRETDWYYYILLHLRDTSYPVRVLDLRGRIVGLGSRVDQQAGPRYLVENLIYDEARLEGTGEYILLFGERRIHGVKFIPGSAQGANGLFEPM
ncbi:MAG TPA: hypothetical protein VHE34_09405 [Puia sp.]|uniref:hypothetical protein n=1 Tax=Puia sp. TaxID=2045100 RepID=UPI002C419D00|nr:hypothetical protein [Puia sp.]HVU95430.1 hypothetical protein [Puia sp.]